MNRAFRHCTSEQVLTAVTLLAASLDTLDVCRLGVAAADASQTELFLSHVMPVIVGCVTEIPFHILVSLMSVVMDRCNVVWLSRSKVHFAINCRLDWHFSQCF